MKSFIEYISEMEGGVAANSIQDGSAVAGLTGDPPVGKRKKKPILTPSPLKRTAPIKM